MKEKNKTNKTQLTEIVFILDRSGSMHGMETDTIGGFNSMLNKQKQANINAIVSTVLFDHEIIVLHDRKKINEIPVMTTADYQPRGSTALLDAIGSSIKHISKIHETVSLEDRPTKTLFVITTDGRENDSQTYNVDTVKMMISIQKEKYNWEFVFLGADIDAISTAHEIGINEKNAVKYTKDSRGTRVMYDTVGDMCCMYSECRNLPTNWKQKIEKDNKRKGK